MDTRASIDNRRSRRRGARHSSSGIRIAVLRGSKEGGAPQGGGFLKKPDTEVSGVFRENPGVAALRQSVSFGRQIELRRSVPVSNRGRLELCVSPYDGFSRAQVSAPV